jgi:microcystin-dependent protein
VSQPYIGEIRMFGGNFAPAGWMFCDGSILAIATNDVLFQLIGTTYGGDGQQTFALPDLRGRAPVHQGTGNGLSARTIGEFGGTETVTITTSTYPGHTHTVAAATTGVAQSPSGGVLAGSTATARYRLDSINPPDVQMAAGSLAPTPAGGLPHENMQPFTTVSFIISMFGIFPSAI